MIDKIKIYKFKILGGILGVFIFAGAVFGAYKLGQKKIQVGPQPTPTPEAVATPTPDPTADWIVYQDIECGYSIKYPPRWFLNRASTCLSQFSDIKSDDPSETRVSVYTILSTREEVMERYNAEIGQKLKHGDIVEEKIANLTIGGEPAVRLTRTSLEGKLYSVFVLFAKDNRVFEIVNVVKNKTDQQRYNDTFNLMLSTFGFIE